MMNDPLQINNLTRSDGESSDISNIIFPRAACRPCSGKGTSTVSVRHVSMLSSHGTFVNTVEMITHDNCD